MAVFAWQDKLATFGDDSVSYLTLAHYFAGSNAFAAEWAGHHSNFPPLFPLLLAITGGASDLRIAYLVLAFCAAGGVAIFYRYAAREIGETGGLIATVLFLFTASAWIGLKGVLSEPVTLLASMASLWYYEARVAKANAGARARLTFGLLLALACLSRVVEFFLVAAYVLHVAIECRARRQRPAVADFLPLVPVLALWSCWALLRPHADFNAYAFAAGVIRHDWLMEPVATFGTALQLFWDAWMRSFVADQDVAAPTKAVFAIVGMLAFAGGVRRAWNNRLDGWYTVFAVALVFAWPFDARNSRRLLYPLLPLLIMQAADFVRAALDRFGMEGRRRVVAWAAMAALPALLCLPPLMLIAHKRTDERLVIDGCPHRFHEIAEYYSTLNNDEAVRNSVVEVAMLCGLGAIDRITAPGAVVMWMRPEYVAVLGHRRAEPFSFTWSHAELAEEIRRRNVDYLLVTSIGKTDQAGKWGLPPSAGSFGHSVFVMPDRIFTLEKIDRDALAKYLGSKRERRSS